MENKTQKTFLDKLVDMHNKNLEVNQVQEKKINTI